MKNRSSIKIMWKLLALVRPLAGWMFVAVITGVLGFICASFITILGGVALVNILELEGFTQFSLSSIFIVMGIMAVLRGVLHYIEHACNHYIAFKLLALIRDKVFTVLRKLAPAKLDGVDKGNLIALVTSDIELLEIFFAHTISPICIALVMAVIMIGFISSFHIYLGIIAAIAYITVGIVVPVIMSKLWKEIGETQRKENGEMNNYVLDSLRGIKEIKQYSFGDKRLKNIQEKTKEMSITGGKLKAGMGITTAITNTCVLGFSILCFVISCRLYMLQGVEFSAIIITTFSLFSSFGAFIALANLGTGLAQTLACGNRVLNLLEEEPMVEEVFHKKEVAMESITLEHIEFAYEEDEILKDFNLSLEPGKITGISGKSGSGKSTILKLLMRFWDVEKGSINIDGENIKDINTKCLRKNQSLVSQDTHLFHESIEENIRLGNTKASKEELILACKKASIHDFIMTLPQGYDTQVGELGDTLSGGERQRIGMARAFLHGAKNIFLDEPTSNLDSLNEAVILKSLAEDEERTVVLVSHRASTMKVADKVIAMGNDRVS